MIDSIRELGTVELIAFATVAVYFSTWIHETGHAVAGALVGFRITSVGMGFGKPLVRFNIAGTVVYASVSRPFQGMTTSVSDSGAMPPISRALLISGGGIANLIAAVSCIAVSAAAGSPPWLLLFGLVNAGLVALAVIPASINIGGASVRTDAAQVISLARGSLDTRRRSGIKDLDRFVDFLARIGDGYGQFHYRIQLAAALCQISNYERAAIVIAGVDSSLYPAMSRMGALFRVVRGSVASENGEDEPASSDFIEAEQYYRSVSVPSPMPLLALLKAKKLVKAGNPEDARKLVEIDGAEEDSPLKRLLSAEIALSTGNYVVAIETLTSEQGFRGIEAVERFRLLAQAHDSAGDKGLSLETLKKAGDRVLFILSNLEMRRDREKFAASASPTIDALGLALSNAHRDNEFSSFKDDLDIALRSPSVQGSIFTLPGMLAWLFALASVAFIIRGFTALSRFDETTTRHMISAGTMALGAIYLSWLSWRTQGTRKLIPVVSTAVAFSCILMIATFWLTLIVSRRNAARETIEYDSNDDGRPEVVQIIEKGVMTWLARDTDADGHIDTWYEYREGKVFKSYYDRDGDGFPDQVPYNE